MNSNEKHKYFQKIAGKRVDNVLESLDALGRCSNPATYLYGKKEIEALLSEIEEKFEDIRLRLLMHSRGPSLPFRLCPPKTVELGEGTVRISELASREEVMALFEDGATSFASLEPIRNRYETQFGDELCWTVPVFHNGYTGCVLLPVREGVMYFPYREVNCETYEQFDPQEIMLLTEGFAEMLLSTLRRDFSALLHVLYAMRACGLVKDGRRDEGSGTVEDHPNKKDVNYK